MISQAVWIVNDGSFTNVVIATAIVMQIASEIIK